MSGTLKPPALRNVIEPPRPGFALDLAGLWRYRDLLLLLVWRDISARYRQSVVGYGWAILKPLLSMVIFTVIFGTVAKLPSEDLPYSVFCFTGLIPWLYFSGAVSSVTTSIVSSGALISKVYFPRLILPLTGVVVGLVELGIQLVLLVPLLGWYGLMPSVTVLLLPVFILAAVLTALAVGLWLTALNVKYRDVGLAVPFFVQAWMWLCPIVYPSQLVPEKWRSIYGLNPMVGVIDGFRWSLLGHQAPDWTMLSVSAVVVAVLFSGGLWYFAKSEPTFADII